MDSLNNNQDDNAQLHIFCQIWSNLVGQHKINSMVFMWTFVWFCFALAFFGLLCVCFSFLFCFLFFSKKRKGEWVSREDLGRVEAVKTWPKENMEKKTLIREESAGATQTALSLAGEPKPIPPFASLRCGFLVFRWGPWSISSWVLCRVIDLDLLAFFYVQLTSMASAIGWRCCLFPQCMFLASLTKIRCPCVYGLMPRSSIWFIDQHAYFMQITWWLLLLQISDRIWIRSGDVSGSSFFIQGCFSYPSCLLLLVVVVCLGV